MPRARGWTAKDERQYNSIKDSQGTGNPNLRIEQHSRDEVYNRARELKIKGRSTMTKPELVEAIRARQGRSAA